MTLALVIPVCNDADGLARLLAQALVRPLISQIVISDDGSDVPVSPDALGLPHLADDPRLVWLRSDTCRGAGHARNIGLAAVTADLTLFFDSDDQVLPDLDPLLLALLGQAFDFCMFRHTDSRVAAAGAHGPLAVDQARWDAAGIADIAPTPVSRAAALHLCRVSAYPWNKVYRTGFLREAGLRCTEVRVHNDIELHWMSFLRARTILASSRICAVHVVARDGNRLTNRRDRDRLQVFRALEPIQAEIAGNPGLRGYQAPFMDVCLRLFTWINGLIQPDLRPEFADLVQAFVARHIGAPEQALIALAEPQTAAGITDLLRRAGGPA